jgi:6-phosphogluconate dehydrogenase
MVHNGIEYGMMQAYAEGFDIFKNATSKELPEDIRYDLNLPGHRRSLAARQRGEFVAARPDGHGAGRESHARRIQRLRAGFRRRPLDDPGRIEEAVPAEVLTAALYTRFRSRQEHTFAEKMLSAMRQKFGGHVEPKNRRN